MHVHIEFVIEVDPEVWEHSQGECNGRLVHDWAVGLVVDALDDMAEDYRVSKNGHPPTKKEKRNV